MLGIKDLRKMALNIAPETSCENGARIGVYVCRCGLNIAQTVDCEKVAQSAKGIDGVVMAKDIAYACSEPESMTLTGSLWAPVLQGSMKSPFGE
jgi:hypothetical protein